MWRWILVGGLMAGGLLTACSDDESAPEEEVSKPLQPLIYTEDPELTPEGAAVRERRLERQLLEGIADGPWGRLEEADTTDFPRLEDEQTLGQTLAEALLGRDEALWEHVFVDAEGYADLVGVDEESAREFVDNQMGKSMETWELFARPPSSQMLEKGLGGQIRFRTLELGVPRDIHGNSTDDDEAVQYWHSRAVLEDVEGDVEFELTIERIFALEDEAGRPMLRVGSPIEADPRFQTFLDAGLHLKRQLLRAREYPFPLGVGTFWRYRRYDADTEVEDTVDSLEQRIDDRPEGLNAEEVIVEVRDVSRYGSVRLVEMLRSYDDRQHTRTREWWVMTPRRIYACDDGCRRDIEDLDSLLDYFERRTPIFVLPLEPGTSWKRAGHSADSEEAIFSVDEQGHDLDVPAGTFTRTFRIVGTDDLGLWDSYLKGAQVVRYFAPDRGVVRRILHNSQEGEEGIDVVEDLVEYRIMY